MELQTYYRRSDSLPVQAVQLTTQNAEEIAYETGGLLVEEIHPESGEKQPAVNIKNAAGLSARLSLGMYLVKLGLVSNWVVSEERFLAEFESAPL